MKPLVILLACAAAGTASGDGTPVFVANQGQVHPAVRFYALGSGAAAYLTDTGLVLELRALVPSTGADDGFLEELPSRRREHRQPGTTARFAVAVRFVGAAGPVAVEPLGEPVGRHRVLRGTASAALVEQFHAVVYRQVWPGVDLVYRAGAAGIDYEIVLQPGADPGPVRFAYQGASAVEERAGSARLSTPLGTVVDRQPPGAGGGSIRWAVRSPAERDRDVAAATTPSAPDPELVAVSLGWATFLGGSQDEAVYAVAVDDQGRPVVTGATRSADYPVTVGVLDPAYQASFDAFVSKLSADGTELLWSTFVGGGADDRGWAIALDAAGNPLVAGVTGGDGFPTTAGAFDESPNGNYDAFVLKLSADGSALLWSSLFGGGDREWDVSGLALDSLGRASVAGSTRSADLPTTPGVLDSALGGPIDAFVARFAADGATLDYATYLGGSAVDAAEDVAVDGLGAAVVVGRTASADFPATAGALQPAPAGPGQDGFVARLAADGGSLSFATYLGGTGTDDPYAVVLTEGEETLVAGTTSSADYPVTAGAAFPGSPGGGDAFVSRLAPAGDALVWSTYLGGSGQDRALALVRDGGRGVAVAGWSCSEDLPVTPGALAASFSGPCDAFLAILSEDGSRGDYLSYLGGWRDESAFGLAVDPAHRLVVGGETWSTNFPTTAGAFAPDHGSPDTAEDGFVVALQVESACTLVELVGGVPELRLQRAEHGACPALPPAAGELDLIEGRVESLSGGSIGEVARVQCASPDASIGTVSVPEPGKALFQLARLRPAGAYTDAGGAGLVGARVPSSGDCPP